MSPKSHSFLRASLATLALSAACAANAEIKYNVTYQADKDQLLVTMTIPTKEAEVLVQMPNWAPGAYVLSEPYRRVQEFAATDEKGHPLQFTNETNTWKIADPSKEPIVIKYTLADKMVDGALHWSGPSTYMYVVGRKDEKSELSVTLPSDWPVMTGLDEVKGKHDVFTAPTYDVLADNPVSTGGDLTIDSYQVGGKTCYIVMRGAAKKDVDREHLKKACQFVTEAESGLFKAIPYNHYVWHFAVNSNQDGAGGLEHLASTEITLAAGVGPRAVGVLFHEFFHLWNVKRIRSKPLGPFDYNQLPKTGALWWLEGVTDYYAHTLPYRDGWWGEDQYFKDIQGNIDIIKRNPARLQVSPYEASYRVGEANNGRGNSNGYQISYYNLGFVGGLMLDIEMRAQTGGKHTLNDVILALWDKCKNSQPGFEEDEIRKQCVRFGGEPMGAFYDQVIMKPGEMPIDQEFAKVGLKMGEVDEHYADTGFTWVALTGKGASVNKASGPASDLKVDDVITEINGVSLVQDNARGIGRAIGAELAKAKVGTPITLKVKRGEQNVQVTVTPVDATRKVVKIEHDPNASPEALKLGAQFMKVTPIAGANVPNRN